MRPSVPTVRILEAAAALVAEVGFDDVSMDAIATRAGVAKGVLYLRFRDKVDLLVAIVRWELACATRETQRRVEADAAGGLLSRLYVHSLAALYSRPALIRFYRDEPQHLVNAMNRDDGTVFRSRALLGAAFIRELQGAGMVVADLDAEALAQNLALWSYAFVAKAPHADLDALVLGMGELMGRAVDADVEETTAGKRCFARFAQALIDSLGVDSWEVAA